MQLADHQRSLLDQYLDHFRPLVGDRRTERTFRGTVQGIVGAETLVCSRIAAFSPVLAAESHNGGQRIRRMASGQTTKRSEIDADHLVQRLQERGVEQLSAEEEEVWAIIDSSELRKPYAREMQDLMRVRSLGGQGTVPGYRKLNVLGIGTNKKRGILYHRLFSSNEGGFESESGEIQRALDSVGKALEGQRGKVTYIGDTQFDDVAVWGTIWEQGNHLMCRLKHRERLVKEPKSGTGPLEGAKIWQVVSIEQASRRALELARVSTKMVVRQKGQRREKRQAVTAIIAACPIRVQYQVDVRSRKNGAIREKDVWLVEVRIEKVGLAPWLLVTDWPVVDGETAMTAFRMYRQRWAVEDSFKFTKQILGWEDVQLLSLEAARTLVALGWVAAGFLYELGVTLEWSEVQLLGRLGGWGYRRDRPPGKTILTRGLQRLLDRWTTDNILRDEIARHGQLPSRIAAFLGPNPLPIT